MIQKYVGSPVVTVVCIAVTSVMVPVDVVLRVAVDLMVLVVHTGVVAGND